MNKSDPAIPTNAAVDVRTRSNYRAVVARVGLCNLFAILRIQTKLPALIPAASKRTNVGSQVQWLYLPQEIFRWTLDSS
jgi:hypothetical protein